MKLNLSKIIIALLLLIGSAYVVTATIHAVQNRFRLLAQQLTFQKLQNKETEMIYQDSLTTVRTLSTTKDEKLRDALKNIDFLHVQLDSLKLVSVHSGTGTIVIRDSLLVHDSLGQDAFFCFEYDSLTHKLTYSFQAKVIVEGVQTKDKYNNIQTVEGAYLQSIVDPTKVIQIPWVDNFTILKPAIHPFRFWNPRLQSDVLVSSSPMFGLSTSFMSYGTDKYVETTDFYFLDFGVASNFKDKTILIAFPVKYNLGRVLPFITNLNVGLGMGWNLTTQKPSLELGVGITH